MQCRNEHQSKSKFATKMKSYFVWFTCAMNFVTLFSIILQLIIEHRGMAMEIGKTIKDAPNEIQNLSPTFFESIEETVLGDGDIDFMKGKRYVKRYSDAIALPQREVGVSDRGFLDMTCQLQDGSQWTKCQWKHGFKSLSIQRDSSYNGLVTFLT